MKRKPKLLKNKRGFESFIMEYGLPFVFLIVVITLYVRITQNINSQHAYIGEKAFDLISSKTELNILEFKYQELARYHLYSTLHEFASNGALPSLIPKEKCGLMDGYSKWTKYALSEKELAICYPENILISNLESLYSQRLTNAFSQILPDLNAQHDFDMKFNLDTKGLTVKETSQQQAVITFSGVNKLSKPLSLGYTIPYDLSIYGRLIAFSKQTINKCQIYPDQNLNTCIETQVSDFNQKNSLALKHTYTDFPRTIKFDLEDKPLPIFENNRFRLKPITYKFALDVPEPKLKIELLQEQVNIAVGSKAQFLLTFSNMPEKLTSFTDDSMVAYIKTQQGNGFTKLDDSTVALDDLTLDKNSDGYIIPLDISGHGNFILVISILKDIDFAQLKAGEEYTSKKFNVVAVEQ